MAIFTSQIHLFLKLLVCLVIFNIVLSQKASAQFLIKGRLMGSGSQPLEMAEVILLKKDSTAIKSIFSDINGLFELKEKSGDYLLHIKLLGKILYRKGLALREDTDLGILSIENAQILKGIVVVGKKPLFESKADRFIFNVENSSLSMGNNTWDVLRQTPLLTVEQEKLAIVGAQIATVYINDRKSILRGKDLFQYLKSMPSDNIIRIEVITSPSAKYDAADGSIINLVLKKTEVDGFRGVLTLTDEQKRGNSPSGNLNLNYHRSKYSQNVAIYLGQNNSITTENLENTDLVKQSLAYITTTNKSMEYRIGGTTAVSFEATENSTLGGVLELHYNNNDDTKLTTNSFHNSLAAPYGSKNINNGAVHMIGGSIFYKLTQKNKNNLDLSLDYFRHSRKNNNKFSSDQSINARDYTLRTSINNNTEKDNYAFKVDYTKTVNKMNIKIETGIKINLLRTNSPYVFSEWGGNTFVINPFFSNHFEYKENINSAYFTFQRKFLKKIDILLGVRYENTNIKTLLYKSDNTQNTHSNDFLPSLNVNYVLNKSHRLSLGYRPMLWRPYSNELNPFIFKLNENYLISGNSNLYRAKVQALRINYSFKNDVVVLLSAEQVNNPILNNTKSNDGMTLTKPENFDGKVRRLYLGVNYNTSFLKNKITFNISSGVYKIDNSEIYPRSKNSLYNSSAILISANNPLKIGINIGGYLGYTSSYTLVNKNTLSFVYNTFDVSKNHKNYKFKIGLIDPFKLIKNQYTTNSSSGIYTTIANYNQRGINFSISKSFGNKKTKKPDFKMTDKGRSENGNSNIK